MREVPRLRERFEREARAVAALRHPHICVLYDIGEADGIAFLVMELLEEETLAERLTRGPLERDELFRCAIDVSDALTETHRQGVVHGDLKPGNVMLTPEGAKLLDSGLATLTVGVTPAGSSFGGEMVTATTTTIGGTPAYMRPNSSRAWPPTGGLTFSRSARFSTRWRPRERRSRRGPDRGRRRPLSRIRRRRCRRRYRRGPGILAPVIDRCLAHDPADRWPRTLDMADELRRISIASNPIAQIPPPASRGPLALGWWRLSTVAVLVSVLCWWAVGRWSWLVGPASPSELPSGALLPVAPAAPLSLGKMRLLTADDRLEVDPTFSPDGHFIAYAAGTATGMRIFVRPVGEGHTRPLTGTADALEFHPRWSLDGREILYVTPTGAFIVAAAGGRARRVDSETDRAGSYSAATPSNARRIFTSAIWSPDGRRLAIAYGGSLSIVAADGLGERRGRYRQLPL